MAYYEAGRALACWCQDLPFGPLSLHVDDAEPSAPASAQVTDAMVIAALAGHAAEDRYAWGGWDGKSPAPDIHAVPLPSRFTVGDSRTERQAAFAHCWRRAHVLVETPRFWVAIETLASRLVAETRLPADEAIIAICAATARDELDREQRGRAFAMPAEKGVRS